MIRDEPPHLSRGTWGLGRRRGRPRARRRGRAGSRRARTRRRFARCLLGPFGPSCPYHKGNPILLANSMGQNRCGKICSRRSANSDKKRALVLSISTKIRGMIHSFLLVVISPAVSEILLDRLRSDGGSHGWTCPRRVEG